MLNQSETIEDPVPIQVARATRKQVKQACERCRASKLKCSGRSLAADSSCARCTDLCLTCTFQPISARKRRKRTDARVSSLESELKQMKSMFKELRQSKDTPSEGSTPQEDPTNLGPDPFASSASSTIQHTPGAESNTHNRDFAPVQPLEFWEILSRSEAEAFLESFRYLSLPQYPILELPPEDNFATLSETRPILLLAMVTAGSAAHQPGSFEKLHKRLIWEVAERAIVNGERSVELVQTIRILESWYCPPQDLRRLNFYQWIHIAGTMAMQLGLGGFILRAEPKVVEIHSDQDMARLRTMLSVFEACSSVAISVNRQAMITFPAFAHKSLAAFESRATTINDLRLVAWVKLQLLCEKVEATKAKFMAYKQSSDTPGLVEMHQLGSEFEEWEQSLGTGVLNLSLRMQFYYCRLKLYELTMFTFHDVENLVPPYLETHNSTTPKMPTNIVNPPFIKAIIALVDSCHAMIRCLRLADVMELRCCPTITFVRCLCAIKILSILQGAIEDHGNPIVQVIDHDGIKFQQQINSFLSTLEAASGTEERKVPSMIANCVRKILDRTVQTQQPTSSSTSNEPGDANASGDSAVGAQLAGSSDLRVHSASGAPEPRQTSPQMWDEWDDAFADIMQPWSDLEEMLLPTGVSSSGVLADSEHGSLGLI